MNQNVGAEKFHPVSGKYATWIDPNGKMIHCVILCPDDFDEDGDPAFKIKDIDNEYAPYIKVKAKELSPSARPKLFST
ncbi:MAG TPA: hypothetical protein P5096_02750 [Patescibacteria group bacterium]|nr:hypothetical protein [Patescibacteria group bacterium]